MAPGAVDAPPRRFSAEVYREKTAFAAPRLCGFALKFAGLESVLDERLIGVMEPHWDGEDFDGDPRTDAYLLLAWADLDAAWPG